MFPHWQGAETERLTGESERPGALENRQFRSHFGGQRSNPPGEIIEFAPPENLDVTKKGSISKRKIVFQPAFFRGLC